MKASAHFCGNSRGCPRSSRSLARTPDSLVAWGSKGRVYSVPVSALPGGRGDGVPVTSLIELESGTHLLHYFAANAEQQLLLASSNGFGFLAKLGDMVSRQKAGKAFMTIDEGCVPLAPMPMLPGALQVACLSSSGRLLVFGLDEMKTLSGGGRGVTLMQLDDNEKLVQALAIGAAGIVPVGTGRDGKAGEDLMSGARPLRCWLHRSASAHARAAVRSHCCVRSSHAPA